jgi:uncharacterized membrane protein
MGINTPSTPQQMASALLSKSLRRQAKNTSNIYHKYLRSSMERIVNTLGDMCIALGTAVALIVFIMLILVLSGYIVLRHDWWDDAGPNDGKPYDNRQKQ